MKPDSPTLDEAELVAIKEWLVSACPKKDYEEILLKTAATFSTRRQFVKSKESFKILIEYPRFKDTKDLVNI